MWCIDLRCCTRRLDVDIVRLMSNWWTGVGVRVGVSDEPKILKPTILSMIPIAYLLAFCLHSAWDVSTRRCTFRWVDWYLELASPR